MYTIEENYSLSAHNTFNINAKCKYFVKINSIDELLSLFNSEVFFSEKRFVIGAGSNLLFINNFNGLVIEPVIKGIKVISENKNELLIEAGAGETWDDFVNFCCDKDYYGAENLSFIPGRVGASPVQNIGAYGVEAKDIIHSVKALEIETGEIIIFTNEECKFAYRDSIFKNEYKDKFIVISVIFKLRKNESYTLDYGNLSDQLSKFDTINLKNIRNTIIEIRKSKLPSPEEYPNAGSFFKNPVVDKEIYNKLHEKYPKLVCYDAGNIKVKLAAGQLIELCGWKGERIDKVGVFEKQALVIVNYSNATGKEILDFSVKIQESVKDKFGIELEREVLVVL